MIELVKTSVKKLEGDLLNPGWDNIFCNNFLKII